MEEVAWKLFAEEARLDSDCSCDDTEDTPSSTLCWTHPTEPSDDSAPSSLRRTETRKYLSKIFQVGLKLVNYDTSQFKSRR